MKIINSSVGILDPDWSLKGIYRAIETAGRTCYKSVGTRYFRVKNQPKNAEFLELINELSLDEKVHLERGPFDDDWYVSIPDARIKLYHLLDFNCEEETLETCAHYQNMTADDFVQMMINSGHGAMLEHGTVYLTIPKEENENSNYLDRYNSNHFSKVAVYDDIYVTTNLRVIVENDWWDDLKFLSKPTKHHYLKVSARFICDRGVSHELVRHRGNDGMSYAQESTRYCNYSKNKFGNELTFIEPSWEFPKWELVNVRERFEAMLAEAEANYMELISLGLKPQEARAILPTEIKTEVVVTAFIDDWKHFFELRCSERSHPDIRVLAYKLKNLFEQRNLIQCNIF